MKLSLDGLPHEIGAVLVLLDYGASRSPARSHPLDELTADFPAGVSGSVDIDIPAPGHQVGSLGVGQMLT